jgi:carboxypeptidase PM20D1
MTTKLLFVLAPSILLLPCVLFINTLRFSPEMIPDEPLEPVNVDQDSAAQHLAQALRFQTVSDQEAGQGTDATFRALHQYLEDTFPGAHAMLTRERVGERSLLSTWKGRDATLEPILLMAHQDVVPVERETLADWEQPPFEGRIAGGHIWGRGALDDKSTLLGVMEAVELLISQGFQPRRTVYLALGGDEEIGGNDGAAQIAELLRQRHVALEYVLDEGLGIADGITPDLRSPVALIGIAEKGFVSLELSAKVESGHSSTPPPHTAIGILGAAVNRLEDRQMPASIDGVTRQMLEAIGPELPLGKRVMIANLWLFKPLVLRSLSKSPATDATIRTTPAATIVEGGLKENVLPTTARAVVNFRILPGDSIERVVSHAREVVNDPRVRVSRSGAFASEPSPVSSVNSAGFQTIQRTIRQVFPGVLVAPALVIVATDSRHYWTLTNNIYRFSPLRMRRDDLERVHGTNERISTGGHAWSVRFFFQVIRNSAQ